MDAGLCAKIQYDNRNIDNMININVIKDVDITKDLRSKYNHENQTKNNKKITSKIQRTIIRL